LSMLSITSFGFKEQSEARTFSDQFGSGENADER